MAKDSAQSIAQSERRVLCNLGNNYARIQPAPQGRTRAVSPYAALSAAHSTRWRKTLQGKTPRRRAPGNTGLARAMGRPERGPPPPGQKNYMITRSRRFAPFHPIRARKGSIICKQPLTCNRVISVLCTRRRRVIFHHHHRTASVKLPLRPSRESKREKSLSESVSRCEMTRT